jgi:acetyl-CoA acetyltransferase
MTRVAIAGIAELTSDELEACEGPIDANAAAIAAAAADAGVELGAIDAVLTYDSIVAPDLMQANRVAEYLGLAPAFASTIGSAGATPTFAVAVAKGLIETGLARTVVFAHSDLRAAGGRSSGLAGRMASIVGNPQFEDPFGPILPTLYSFLAGWLIETGQATREDLARIAVQTRAWAGLNPNARMREPLTLDQVLEAPPVAGALGRYDCCLITDFSGALVLSAETAGAAGAVEVLAAAGTATHEELLQMDPDDPLRASGEMAAQLYERAGVGIEDIDLAYLYDSFTVTVALQLLAYRLDRGEGLAATLADGGIGPGGRVPVNTHGGLLSATTSGVFHLVEAVRQLRGSAGDRQVDGAATALVSNIGGVFSNNCALVLGRR